MEITVYAAGPLAGLKCPNPAEKYGDNWRESHEVRVFEGTPRELIDIAELMQRHNDGSATRLRTARTLYNAAAPDRIEELEDALRDPHSGRFSRVELAEMVDELAALRADDYGDN